MFDLRDLRYFQTIAETGHLGRAAVKLGRTQPALTKCLRRLEASIGAAVFVRAGRGLRLTPVGAVLLGRARDMQASLHELTREVTDFAQGASGNVRIGSGATTAEYLLPEVCTALLADTPEIELDIVIGMNDVLRKSLREGALDIVVGPVTAEDEKEFATELFGSDEVVAVASKGHALFRSPVQLADLTPHAWVLPAHSVATRQWLDRAFENHSLPKPRVQVETNNISLLPRLIARTRLLSFISRLNLGKGRVGAPLRELEVPELTMRRKLGLVYRRNHYLSPAAQRLIGQFQKHGREALRGS